MTPDVFAIVADSSACTALLGQPPNMRFYRDEAPPRKVAPYAVWQAVTITPENYLGQLPDIDGARIQVDVYDEDETVVIAVGIAIRNAIEPHAQMLNAATRPKDAQTRRRGMMLDFQFFTPR